MIPRAEHFKQRLDAIIERARKNGKSHIDVLSADLHADAGGFPSRNHRMPTCCSVMRQKMNPTDLVLYEPKKGAGATLKIRYIL